MLLLLLTLLFRLLGSTAEEYFSPSLEMFSVKLGLPPRFAGVTLLALGNGAADVIATMNAIPSDPTNGYTQLNPNPPNVVHWYDVLPRWILRW